MNRDEQIEEMTRSVKEWDDGMHRTLAVALYTTGYRKSNEVAREIIEEIEEGIKAAVSALQFENNPIHRQVKHETYSSLMRFIKTFIEKKYGG